MGTNKDKLKQKLVRRFGEIISAELDKPDDQVDSALIEECDAWLTELLDDPQTSKAELAKQYDALMARIRTEKTPMPPMKKTRRPLRKAVAVLLAAALSVMSLVIVCFAVPAVRNWILAVARMNDGSVIEVDGITYEHNGQQIVYKDKEDLYSATGISFIVPTDPSGNIHLERIVDVSGVQDAYILQYSDKSTVTIRTNDTHQIDSTNPSVTVGSYEFYLYTQNVDTQPDIQTVYGASYFSEEYIYTINTYSYESRESLIRMFTGE